MALIFVSDTEAQGHWETVPDAAPYGSLADVQASRLNNDVYNHFGPGGNDWSVFGNRLYIWPGAGGDPSAEVRAAFPLASAQEIDYATNPAYAESTKGTLRDIAMGVAFVAAPWAITQLAPILGATGANVAIGAGKAAITGGNPLVGGLTGGVVSELRDLITPPAWGSLDAGEGPGLDDPTPYTGPNAFSQPVSIDAAVVAEANWAASQQELADQAAGVGRFAPDYVSPEDIAVREANWAASQQELADQAAGVGRFAPDYVSPEVLAVREANWRFSQQELADQAAGVGRFAPTTMTLADPWGAGTPGLLDQPNPVTEAAAANVLDLVAPQPSGIGLSGAPLPLAWQVALGVPGVSGPIFSTVTPSAPSSSTAGAAPKAPAVLTATAAAGGAGLIEKLLGAAAVAATGAIVSGEIAKRNAADLAAQTPPPAEAPVLAGANSGTVFILAGMAALYLVTQ